MFYKLKGLKLMFSSTFFGVVGLASFPTFDIQPFVTMLVNFLPVLMLLAVVSSLIRAFKV